MTLGSAPAADAQLVRYYARRAREYERIYEKPERGEDLARLRHAVAGELSGQDVLELACGTGYWTRVLAPVARSIVATDASCEVLDVARAALGPGSPVELRLADTFRPDTIAGSFTAALAAFWWSHVPRRAIPGFLSALHARLGAGARVVFLDNRHVVGSSTPIAFRDDDGDTWQERRLEDGEAHLVLKNFPDEAELAAAVGGARDVRLDLLRHYWLLAYTVPPP